MEGKNNTDGKYPDRCKKMVMKRKQLLFFMLMAWLPCLSQTGDSISTIHHFSGNTSVTNNGISLVPSFSLGKPAVMAIMSLGGERFSFDPDIRFSLDGKPWTFLFWARYKLFAKGRFRMNTGAHLGLNYTVSTLSVNGIPTETNVVRRYLAGELAPNYFIAKTISIGAYYLYSHGIDKGTVANTHFITLNSNFSHIRISKQFYVGAVPQLYYLFQDGNDGYYFTSAFMIARQNFPLSLASIINKQLRSNIPRSKDFNWNVGLVYSFNRNYLPRP